MNIGRLGILLDILEQADKRDDGLAFDMSAWLRQAPHRHPPCGYAACACGFAALDPRLRDQGLHIVVIDGGEHQVKTKLDLYHLRYPGSRVSLRYGGFCDFAAAEVFFGLTPREARWLFNGDQYPVHATPAHVIERIRSLLA